MARFSFCPLPEPGHVLPTVRVAGFLRSLGHHVTYITTPAFRSFLASQGFAVHLAFESALPAAAENDIFMSTAGLVVQQHLLTYLRACKSDLGSALLPEIQATACDILVCDAAIMRTCGDALRNGLCGRVVSVGLTLPEPHEQVGQGAPDFVLCPSELRLPQESPAGQCVYAEPSVYPSRGVAAFNWTQVPVSKTLVYASFGSQYARYRSCQVVIRHIVRAFSSLPECHLVMAAGSLVDSFGSMRLPANVSLVRTVPQIDVLRRASAFVTHGGLGSVKESIISGVPMIVLPFDFDQPCNSKRVVHHGLGFCCSPEECTAARIAELVSAALSDKKVYRNVADMRSVFWKLEIQAPAVAYLSSLSHSLS